VHDEPATARSDQPGDVLEFGGPTGGRWRRRWRRLLAPTLVVAALVAVVIRTSHHETPRPRATPPAAIISPTLGDVDTARPTSPAPAITQVRPGLLGITVGWELFGRGPNGVTRIEFARGRLTTTEVPPLASSGPVSFAVGRDWVVIRPLDNVLGYIVRDGAVAQRLTGALGDGNFVYPGPDGRHLWVPTDDGVDAPMALVDIDGRPSGVSIVIPAGTDRYVTPDGTGYLIATGPGGAYLLRPDGRRRITTGTVAAIGPTRLLTHECDRERRCTFAVVDRRSGAHRALDSIRPDLVDGSLGIISPNGVAVALVETDPIGATSVHIVDLATGADRRINATIATPLDDNGMVWSPDSRWLFIAGAHGALFSVDATIGRVHELRLRLPPLAQLAIRDGRSVAPVTAR
jgi:hypothetical protein